MGIRNLELVIGLFDWSLKPNEWLFNNESLVSGKKIVDIINVIAWINFIKLFGQSPWNFFFHFFLDKKVEQKIKAAEKWLKIVFLS